MKSLSRIWRCRSGATAVEYGVWAGVFVVMILAGFGAMADLLEAAFNQITTAISPAAMPTGK